MFFYSGVDVNSTSEITGSGVSGQVSYWNGTKTQTGSTALTVATTVSGSSGIEPLLTFAPVIAQSGTAGFTAFLINVTQTSLGSGTKAFLDCQVAGSSVFRVSNAGILVCNTIWPTADDTILQMNVRTYTGSSGTKVCNQFYPTINQSGTAGYTGLLVNVTEAATGSGTKLLQDWQVGGVSKVSVTSTGNIAASRVDAPLILSSTQCYSTDFLPYADGTPLKLSCRSRSGSTVVQNGIESTLALTQSGTAGYVGFYQAVTETSVGSGAKSFLLFTVGGVTRYNVSSYGVTTLSGLVANSIAMSRHTTADTAGNSLTITSGGATASATDKAAGNLLLYPGVSTGTGNGCVRVGRSDRAGSTGTADNAQYDAIVVMPPKYLTDGSAVDVIDISLANNSFTSGHFLYNLEATDGTDYQTESGIMSWSAVSKGSVITSTIGHTAAASGLEVGAVSTGTLADTWAITAGTGKITITLNANSSLTSAVVRVIGTIFNHSRSTITLL